MIRLAHRLSTVTSPVSWLALAAGVAVTSLAPHARAFPGVYVGKNQEERVNHSTEIVVMKRDNATVVTTMPDYEGPIDAFAYVTVVPGDVTIERVHTLRRDFVDHVDKVSAPRFHEFWEMDPCDPEPLEQEWERSFKADDSTAFLGGGSPTGTKKVAKELYLDVKTDFKEGENQYTLLDASQAPSAWLTGHGYKPQAELDGAVAPYLGRGMRVLIVEVDSKRVELIGGERAQLSPIQFWTETPLDTLPIRLGLLSAPKKDKQELYVYFVHPDQRFETKNYETIVPPTNIKVDFKIKERMGEFYNALEDLIFAKHPRAFLMEFAWNAEGCGQPCASTPLEINELLSLGAHVFELSVPDEEKHPKPPDLTDEEKKAFEDSLKELKTPKEKKDAKDTFEAERKTIAERKALVARNKYLISRLHYRYDKTTLTDDPVFVSTAAPIQGGIWIPQGPNGEVPTETKAQAPNRLQIRYNNYHPSIVTVHCPDPKRWRWGRPPNTYRGLRKTWVAEDQTRKSRTQIKPAEVVLTPIKELGLSGQAQTSIGDGGLDGGANAEKSKRGCGCSIPGRERETASGWLAAVAAVVAFRRARRRP